MIFQVIPTIICLLFLVLALVGFQDTDKNYSNHNNVKDIDGNVYRTVIIGNQIWMAENLKVTHYRDGTVIPNVYENEKWSLLTTGALCWKNNDSIQYKETYGALYNFYAVSSPRNLAPSGWHIPTQSECETLINYLGGKNIAGKKIKDNSLNLWKNINTQATNESGFSGLPAGGRGKLWGVGDVGYYTTWWSATSYDSLYAWHWGLYPDKPGIRSNPGHKDSGFSVRCLKDD